MRVGAVQSSYIPWRGYFDFIASVDLFVFLDDVQFTVRDWRSRNKIKTPRGTEWLTVPVRHTSRSQLICETEINEDGRWRKKHLGSFSSNYAAAAHAADAFALLGELDSADGTISQLNIALVRRICGYLGIATPLVNSTELALAGAKTDRLIDLCRKVGATAYLSGPSADAYLDKEAFRTHGIALEYKSYDYPPYPQLWGEFDGAVTVLDLIANCGAGASHHLRSRTPDLVVVP